MTKNTLINASTWFGVRADEVRADKKLKKRFSEQLLVFIVFNNVMISK